MGKIIRNAIRCLKCGDEIESKHRHDFRTCTCGNASVDGGKDYLRRLAEEPDSYEDISEFEPAARTEGDANADT